MAKLQAPFDPATIEAVAKVLGDTENGLTGSQIGHVLATCKIRDIDKLNTKWKRLYNALVDEQNRKQSGNHMVGFIHFAMKPALWSNKSQQFDWLREELTKVLLFVGLEVREDGCVYKAKSAKTLAESEMRANSLKAKLVSRGVHEDVLCFCRSEWLEKNYFHAVLEATKSVANKIRTKSGLTSDGAELAMAAFSLGKSGVPVMAINSLSTDTEKGEQRGFMNLLIGLFGTFRNPTAHAEKIYWPISEQDALDILSLVSLVHRKLDHAHKI